MISNSPLAYIFIRLTVLLLRLIAPLSIEYCFLRVLVPKYAALPLPLEIIIYAETAFYFAVYLPRRYVLQKPAPQGTAMTRPERNELFDKCLKTIPDMSHFLTTWFKGAPVHELKREDVREWLAWGFFNQGKSSNCDEDELEDYVQGIEEALGEPISPGHGNHKAMRPTIDPINIQHRPLLYYLVSTA
jgi:hypothetical protein